MPTAGNGSAPCLGDNPPSPQEEVHLLVLPDSGMYNFWVTMVLAVVGQAVGLLWVLYEQVK
jgi:meckelin